MAVAAPVTGFFPDSDARAQVQLAEPVDDPEPAIDPAADSSADNAIADRLRGIFREIEGLDGVAVAVDAGVVRLSGPIADNASAERAKAIAQRVSGVVTVESQFERDLSVGRNVEPVVDKFSASLQNFLSALPLIGVAFLVAIFVGLLGHFFASRMGFWKRVTPNIFLAELISGFVRVLFIMVGIFIGLDILNATALLGAVLGGAGVIGLAVGFALRDTVDNYMSSIMLSIRQPFRANDHVRVGEQEGRVVRLTSRATILMTLDGNHLRIPNATVFKGTVVNYTRNPKRRFTLELGVGNEEDLLEVIRVGEQTLRNTQGVLNDPEPRIRTEALGDSTVLVRAYGWVGQETHDFLSVRSESVRRLKEAFDEVGFDMPEPIYRVRLHQEDPPTKKPPIKRSHADTVAVDIRPDNDLQEQVNQTRSGEDPDVMSS